MLHLALHFFVPFILTRWFYPERWFGAYLIMMMSMMIDLDHLFADPIYDSNRCSIGFHPMHKVIPIVGYIALCAIPKLRALSIGLVIHVLLDGLDCTLM
ncbi:MAG TPA: hypothetical protein DGR97_12150 [Gammaproteobacteria bacterium]|nr:hypothetical protein [Gammaproteobacteria bacterium]|tara:strand:- start:296 stop:592 length:297 start_codon:yes stop_codon:yes gene_type:complete